MRSLAIPVVLALMLGLGACEDDLYDIPPAIVSDTVSLALPTADTTQPSALDVSISDGTLAGRFPERLGDAEIGWDFALRLRDGGLVLVPAAALGVPFGSTGTSPGLTSALEGVDFARLTEVPGGTRFTTDAAVPLRVGGVYVARSRALALNFGCQRFAKLQPVEVDVAAGTARIFVAANGNCGDPRLVEED